MAARFRVRNSIPIRRPRRRLIEENKCPDSPGRRKVPLDHELTVPYAPSSGGNLRVAWHTE